MAFSDSDLANIERAIATGTLSVEIEGRKVTYRSMADLREAREMILAERGSVGVVLVRPVYRRGL